MTITGAMGNGTKRTKNGKTMAGIRNHQIWENPEQKDGKFCIRFGSQSQEIKTPYNLGREMKV
jgi:hypothetical protein